MEETTKTFAELMIYLVTLFMTIYAVVLGYHWFKFGASRKMSMTAMFIYVGGSILIIIALVSAFSFL